MNRQWALIRSWHALRPSRAIVPQTLCGRIVPGGSQIVETLPAGRSCESCLRILARQEDQ